MSTIITKGTTYQMTPADIAFARKIATQRSTGSREAGIYDARQSDVESSTEIDFKGAMGEVAFVGMLREQGVYDESQYQAALDLIADPEIRTASSGTDFGDAIVNDKTIDVKTTHHEHGHLVAQPWKVKTTKINVYALMIGKHTEADPVYRFAGVCPPAQVYAANCWVSQDKLYGMRIN